MAWHIFVVRLERAIVWPSKHAIASPDFAEMNDVWDAWVPQGHAPARACGEAKLARDVLKVEIIVTAAIIDLSV
jgi:enamine deaminase RidA (YjgF/YER057c/UK114 family)